MDFQFNVAKIVVFLPVNKSFHYSIPECLVKTVCVGKRVLVPFGSRNVIGYIIELKHSSNIKRLKNVLEVIDEIPLFPQNMIHFFSWLANYYMYPMGEVIKSALPKGLNLYKISHIYLLPKGKSASKAKNTSTLDKEILFLLINGPKTLEELKKKISKKNFKLFLKKMERKNWIQIKSRDKTVKIYDKKTKYVSALLSQTYTSLTQQRSRILDYLRINKNPTLKNIISVVKTTSKLIHKMAEDKQVKIYELPYHKEGPNIIPETRKHVQLTKEQQYAVNTVSKFIGEKFKTFLLNGVTGSGKTEVYLRLAGTTLARKLSVLVLVPEIALVLKIKRDFQLYFGDCIAVIHSGLTKLELYNQWLLILKNKVSIVLGARSSIFAPLDNLGLIVVDEEHDSSYKQERVPFYNARDLAIIRAKHCNAVALLGSATPSVQSWFNAQNGKFLEISMPYRVKNRPLPKIDVVDLSKNKIARGSSQYFTPKLIREIELTLDQGHQTILFLNRRGFSSFSVCMNCGKVIRCKNCDISLKLHYNDKLLICHYCGFSKPFSSLCHSCNSYGIRSLGIGTEKLEMMIKDIFPKARVGRLDKDTTQKRGSSLKILEYFKTRKIDILVGTQMLTKGHDFPGVTLVGIICADLTMNFPDFRSNERTFQIISQVSGRAGRGNFPGKIILQTYNPEHFSIVSAKNQDFQHFYRKEIEFRKVLSYPPFSRIIQIKIFGKDEIKVIKYAEKTKKLCCNLLNSNKYYSGNILVLGPVELPISRLDSYYRWQIVLKGLNVKRLHAFTKELIESGKLKSRSSTKVLVNVDPISVM